MINHLREDSHSRGTYISTRPKKYKMKDRLHKLISLSLKKKKFYIENLQEKCDKGKLNFKKRRPEIRTS